MQQRSNIPTHEFTDPQTSTNRLGERRQAVRSSTFMRAAIGCVLAVLISPSACAQTLVEVRKDPKASQAFDSYLKRAKDTVARYANVPSRTGYVVIGQIRIDAGDDFGNMSSQMRIIDGGFFADAVRDLSKPIRFQCHGYHPLELVVPADLKPDADGIYDVGVVQMQRCPPSELSQISGVVKLEGGRANSKVSVSLRHSIISPNTVSGGYGGGSSKSISASVSPNGSWILKDIAPGDYYISFYGSPHLGSGQALKVEPSESRMLDDVTLELPHELKVDFIAAEADTWEFSADHANSMDLWTGQSWKVAGSQYSSELRLDQKDHKLTFSYGYAPCYLTDLGEGELDDFCGKTLKAERGSPQKTPVIPGHVYLLNQLGTGRNVLFTTDIGGPVAIGQTRPDGMPRRKASPKIPGVVAHYSFDGHANELNGTAYPMDVRNVEFSDTTMILNGKSEQTDRAKSSRASTITPAIKPTELTLRIRFKATEDSATPQPIFVGGSSSHWLIIERASSGELTISLNNGTFTQRVPNIRVEKDTWTTLICAVSVPQKMVAVAVDSGKPSLIQLPPDFRLLNGSGYFGSQQFQFSKSGSNGSAFCGEIDELTILDGVMSQAKFDAVMKRLRSLK